MKSAPSVVHVSKTPLVGAPAKVASALDRFTQFRSCAIVGQDYPKALAGLFLGDAVLLDRSASVREVCANLIRRADIVHVHNDLTPELLELVRKETSGACRFVYQAHSPLREGPLFADRSEALGLEWAAKLCIPHSQQRFFQRHRLVPNVVLHTPSVRVLDEREPLRLLFSPAHRRTGLRWNDKVSEALDKALMIVRSLTRTEILEVGGVAPAALFALRRTTHVTIDEIVTGAFHQISLEGLCAGNVVVNGADPIALSSLRMAIRAAEDPPFVSIAETDVCESLLDLMRDRERIRRVQQQSYEYFRTYLDPARLVGFFADVYEEVLDAA